SSKIIIRSLAIAVAFFYLVKAVIEGQRYLTGRTLKIPFAVKINSLGDEYTPAGVENISAAQGKRTAAFENIFAQGDIHVIFGFVSTLGGIARRAIIDTKLTVYGFTNF